MHSLCKDGIMVNVQELQQDLKPIGQLLVTITMELKLKTLVISIIQWIQR